VQPGRSGRTPVLSNSMKDVWVHAVEQIVLSAEERKLRVIGFTSPHDHLGVGELSRMVADMSTRAGLRTLLIDLSQDAAAQRDDPSWSPGAEGIDKAIIRPPSFADFQDRGESEADLLQACRRATSHSRYNNVKALRQAFAQDLSDYDRIVLVLPEVGRSADVGINPLGPAAACDAVYLVCAPNVTGRDDLANATSSLRASGTQIAGLILNEAGQMTLGEEMARSVERIFRAAPRLGAWIAKRARTSKLLN
jgi:hypothetical protein